MRKFTPAEGFNRVSFAARGQDALVVVDQAGLSVEETEKQPVTVVDEETGEERTEEIEVPINGDLLSALDAHPLIQEVAVGKGQSEQHKNEHKKAHDDSPAETPGE